MSGVERAIRFYSSKLPEDVSQAIMLKQQQARNNCGCVISQQEAVYKIIREWHKVQKSE